MPSFNHIRVLSISDDNGLRTSRDSILRRDGYEIVSVFSDELLTVPEIRTFDVAIMCHSVPPNRALAIVDRLRRYNPDIRLLRVNPRLYRSDPLYDVDSEVLAWPGALLKAVKALLERNGATAGVAPARARTDEYCGPFAEFPLGNSRAS